MKPEIKQRIEKIRKGEVPEGYKETKFGTIPTDWQVDKLQKFTARILDGTHSTPKYKEKGIPFYSVENVTSDNFTNTKFISEEEHKLLSKRCHVEKGDILMTRIGAIGDTRLIDWDVNASMYVSLALIKLKPGIDPNYILCYTKSIDFLREVHKYSLQNATPQKINMSEISKIMIKYPTDNKEQNKISDILLLSDKSINLTKKLIDNIYQFKKGFVQKIIYNKANDSIPKKWSETYLKKCLIPTSYPVDKPTKPYTALGIRSHCKGTMVKPVDDPSKVDMDTLYEVKENELIVNITFAWEGAIAILKKKDEGKLVSHRFPTFKFNEACAIPDYFEHLIKTKWFVFQLGLVSPGGAGRNRVLSKKEFLKIRLVLPPVDQQRKIANFLNSLDEEINLLKKELDKLKEQKKGLMQLLLTGIVRVKVD